MHRKLMLTLTIVIVWICVPSAQAQVRLIGITGEQGQPGGPDETLFEINLTNASTTLLFAPTHIPDTNAIGYNPVNGLVYHFSGSEAYRNDPARIGYRDNQYLETVNLQTQALTAIFNANPPPSPDTALAFGLAAPRPDWVLPAELRTDEQIDPSFRQRGVDEYHGAREATWSKTENLFYIADEHGLFKVTPTGDSTFVGQPAIMGSDMKGISFVEVGGQAKLYAGAKELQELEPGVSTSNLFEIDPATGQEIGQPITIMAPIGPSPSDPLESNHRILGLTQHPETGVLYGLLEPLNSDPVTNRQLVTINLTTGVATLIGELRTPDNNAAFASIEFVGFSTTPPGVTGDFNNNGTVDAADYVLWRDGGTLQNDPTQGNQPGDYDVWRMNFGKTAGGGAAIPSAVSLSASVPEPAACVLLLSGLAIFMALRRKRAAL
jgi:hypothetical protein